MKWGHSVCELMSVSVYIGGEVTGEGDVVGRVLPVQGDPEGVPGVGVSVIVARQGTLGREGSAQKRNATPQPLSLGAVI